MVPKERDLRYDTYLHKMNKLKRKYDSKGFKSTLRSVCEYFFTKSRLSTTYTSKIYNHAAYKYYSKKINERISTDYESPLYVFELRYTDPSKIKFHTTRRFPPWNNKKEAVGLVVGGNWDKKEAPYIDDGYEEEYKNINKIYQFNKRFENSVLYQSFYNHFINGVGWRETNLIRKVISNLDNSIIWHQCKNEKEVLERCNYIDSLYKSIKYNGYKKQFEVGACGDFLECLIDEICIDIGREGELYLVDGRHRLAISKILEIEEIPVMVLARHEEWMEKRELSLNGQLVINHPDIIYEGCYGTV